MKSLRKGREFYSQNYEKVMELHSKGMRAKEISEKLNISYSAVYHWIKGLRKPEAGNIVSFIEYFRANGPMPVVEIEKKFPKHNELFLVASRRGAKIKRYVMKRKYGSFSVWYLMEGQEEELNKRLDELFEKIKDVKDKLRKAHGLK